MTDFGTAPHRILPGVWVTLGGRHLTAAGNHYWENQFKLGAVDRYGHYNHRIGDAIKTARTAPTPAARKQAGHVLGNEARRQQHEFYKPKGTFQHVLADTLGVISPVPTDDSGPLGTGLVMAGILPFGKGARAASRLAKLGHGAEDAAKVAKVPGPKSFVTDALGAAKEARVKQDALHSAERARRIKASGQAFQEAGGGLEGHAASIAKLRGELPKVRFDDLTGISTEDMGKLMNIVEDNPNLREWEAVSLRAGLLRAASGQVPRDFEIDLMRRAFGVEKATEFANASLGQRIRRTVADVINIPRAVMSSADVSAVLRQSLVATMHRPGVAAKNLGPMFKMMFKQGFYDDAMKAIQDDPRFFHAVHDDGLKMTDIHGPMGTREEAYPSQLAERIPIAGRVVKGSSRAYTGFINLMRWHVYTELLDMGEMGGTLTPKLRRDAAKVANWSTGRGELPGKTLESAAPLLNTVFFSPRLMASRFQTFNPFFYASLDPVARKYAIKAAVKTFLAGTSVLAAAKAAGAKVGTDPTSADFGKIKIGDTRLDVWGGHQQWARVAGQLAEGKITSTTTGKTIRLSGGFKGSSRWDVGSRFFQGKFSPPASLVRDWSHHTDFAGKPFSWKKATLSRAYPLLIQDMLDTFHEYGVGPAVGVYGLGAFGVGVQTYGSNQASTSQPSPAFGKGGFGVWGNFHGSSPFAKSSGGSDVWSNFKKR